MPFLYVLAGLVAVVTGSALIIGLAAIMVAGECSEAERRSDPDGWGVE